MRWLRAAVGVVVILGMPLRSLADVADGQDPTHGCGEAQARAHGCEYSFTLAAGEFTSVFGTKEDGTLAYSLPLLKAFDRLGLQILDRKGYSKGLAKFLETATASATPVNGGRTLTEELSRVRTRAGPTPLMSALSDADFFIVTYEAEWCVPCKTQLKNVRRFADANRKARINLVRVDADLLKLDAEMQQQLLGSALQTPTHEDRKR